MGLDGSVKEYVVDNDTNIQMAPDLLFELINFTKYEKSTNTKKKTATQDKRDRKNIPEAVSAVVEDFQQLAQLNSEFDFVHGYLHCLEPNEYQTWYVRCMFFVERLSPISHLGTCMGETIKQVHIFRHAKNNR